MVESEVAAAGIKHPAVLASMRAVPRHEFVPADMRAYSYFDMALPIGDQATISPPFVVASMTQQLDPQPTDRVLEIGTGSGYQAAVLSALVKEVYSIEIVPRLADKAKPVLAKLGYKNVVTKTGDGYLGWPEAAPFDKIIVTCSPEKVPTPLVEQLREGGRIIVPLGDRYQQSLYTLVKEQGKLVVESREPTFFVPMTGEAEALRGELPQVALTPLTNGSFEEELEPGKLAGWYYVRQATIAENGPIAAAPHALAFANRVPGRNSQALQAVGVDGRRVADLIVELWTQARDVKPAPDDAAAGGGGVLISFFDEDRAPAGQQLVGPWKGSSGWQRRAAVVKVPSNARVAIVAAGLFGSTGELTCDELTVKVGRNRSGGP